MLKFQIPSTKSQINSKHQLANDRNFSFCFGHWKFGHWKLFGIWDLLFGICLYLVAWLLVISSFAIGCSPQKPKEDKIVIWHWMNDRREAFAELAQKYKAQTKTEIEFKLFSPPDIYSQKVIAAAKAGRLPDLFGILGEKKTLASFINAGYILDLTAPMSENEKSWEESFYPQALDVTRFKKGNLYEAKEGIYGVPIDITVMEFVYNKDLFQRAGLDPQNPPVEFEQFIDYAKKIKDALGVEGFICGWGEGWLLNALAMEWAINIMGEENLFKTIKGDLPYTDQQWLEVFSKFEQMRQAGILASDIVTLINKEAEDRFSRGEVAFAFNGTWAINVYKQLGPDLDYAFFRLPKISHAYPVKTWGGAGASFMVNAQSAGKEKVVDFLKWITAKKQQEFLAQATNNLPSVKSASENLPEILKALADDLDALTHPNIWPYNEDSQVVEAINTGLQQIVMGMATPAEVLQEVQEIKERLSRR